MTMRLADTF